MEETTLGFGKVLFPGAHALVNTHSPVLPPFLECISDLAPALLRAPGVCSSGLYLVRGEGGVLQGSTHWAPKAPPPSYQNHTTPPSIARHPTHCLLCACGSSTSLIQVSSRCNTMLPPPGRLLFQHFPGVYSGPSFLLPGVLVAKVLTSFPH